ncbi:MAG: hypothetical protein AAB300_01985 [Nitrospirota bacterium]
MKSIINLSMLLKKEAITSHEFERFRCLSSNKEDVPDTFSDLAIGFGFISINYGFIGLYIASTVPIYLMLLEGCISFGLGYFLSAQSNRILLTTICFVYGACMIVASILR